LVFAVKGRQNFIKELFRDELEKYICGIARNKLHKPLSIYCMPDHLHFLLGLHPAHSISDLVKVIKTSSSDFINERHFLRSHFQWQEGYGAFSYSRSQLDRVSKYILNQKQHHKKQSFRQEYLNFLKKFEIEFDQKYLFEFYD
jgi:putative transposase